jgi:hypothetical protein
MVQTQKGFYLTVKKSSFANAAHLTTNNLPTIRQQKQESALAPCSGAF